MLIRLRAQWNEALLQLVVAPAYLDLLAAAAKLLGPGEQYTRSGCTPGLNVLPSKHLFKLDRE